MTTKVELLKDIKVADDRIRDMGTKLVKQNELRNITTLLQTVVEWAGSKLDSITEDITTRDQVLRGEFASLAEQIVDELDDDQGGLDEELVVLILTVVGAADEIANRFKPETDEDNALIKAYRQVAKSLVEEITFGEDDDGDDGNDDGTDA